jgi:hypothetical protein
MSILTLNMLGYLSGFGAHAGGFHTGEPWTIPAGVTSVTLPTGRNLAVTPGTLFNATGLQGIYYLNRARTHVARAVNLDDLATSDLTTVAPITIASGKATAGSAAVEHAPLTPYILAAILFLIIFESLLVYRRRRPAMQA